MSTINVVSKSTDQTTTSGSYVDVTDLNFEVGADTDYQFMATLVLSCSSGLASPQVAVNGPSGPTQLTVTYSGFTALTTPVATNKTAYDDGLEPTLSAGTSRTQWTVRGTLRNGSTAGVVSLRVRSSNGSATVTVHQGSSLVYNTP